MWIAIGLKVLRGRIHLHHSLLHFKLSGIAFVTMVYMKQGILEGNPFGVQFYKATTRGSLRSPLAIVGCPFGAKIPAVLVDFRVQ